MLEKEAHVRKIALENGKTVLTAGPGSYVRGADFTAEDDDIHVSIGRCSALSDGVTFIFQKKEEDTSAAASCTAADTPSRSDM